MHRAVSINSLCFHPAPVRDVIDAVARLGARAISPTIEDMADPAAARGVRDAGLVVATLTHRAFAFADADQAAAARERLDRTIDLAAAIGAGSITMTTGGRGDLDWPDAAARFAAAILPCAERARAAGVALAIEPTSHLYADVSIAHRLAEADALAAAGGIGVGVDLFACWADADIAQAIARAGPRIALVQVSDQVAGDRALPCRAVPGDGMVPLAPLIAAIEATGYAGRYDIEVIGPRLAAEGASAGLARAAAHLATILGNGETM